MTGLGGCSGDCCTVDSFPITLERAPPGVLGDLQAGGLLVVGRSDGVNGGNAFLMSLDTGAALTVFDGSADEVGGAMTRSLDVLDASDAAPGATSPPLRARFTGITTLTVPVGNGGDASLHPLGILGADILSGYSVELRFTAPSLTFWDSQRADDGFLADAGYAVIHFTPFGGGEVTAEGNPDFLGLRGPLEIGPSRIVFRTCAAPPAFDPAIPSTDDACCKPTDAMIQSHGTDLSLMLSTGVGPVVLAESAWQRILPNVPAAPPPVPGPLWIATAAGGPGATPPMAGWTTIPRLALVNQEATANDDAGPCVDLARARRLERVSFAQAAGATAGTACAPQDMSLCVQPCDMDPHDPGKALNSAAYVEVGGDLVVAIVADDDPMLQGLRADIRPEGPEIDGIIGAGALRSTRVELDYRSTSPRAIFSCDGPQPRNTCWTGARCPRLPDGDHCHACFNLPPHTLPRACMASGCGS
jgi:hypothetical protein